MAPQFLKIGIGSALAITLSGCASYAQQRPAFVYLPAACSAPGAFPALAIDPRAAQPVPALPPGASPALPVAGATAPPVTQSLGCLMAVPIPAAAYAGRPYGGYGYYDPYYRRYGYGGFGSIGIGIGVGGGHGWIGHGSGHFGSHGHHGH